MSDDAAHVRAQDLDRYFVPAILRVQAGEMHLGDRSAGHRGGVEFGEDFAGRTAVSFLNLRQRQPR